MQKEYIELCVSCCRGEFDIGSIELIKSPLVMRELIVELVERLWSDEKERYLEDGGSLRRGWNNLKEQHCEFISVGNVHKELKCGGYSNSEEGYCLLFEKGSEFWDELKEVNEECEMREEKVWEVMSDELYERLQAFEESVELG